MKTNFLIVLLTFFLAGSGLAEKPTVDELLALHQKSAKTLEDVQAKATLNLKVTVGVFPYSEKLSGRYFYLKPNNHRLEFDDAPSYFDDAPSLFNWDLPSLEKYRAKVKGPYTEGDGAVFQLLFLPKNADSSTQSVLCTFDTETWRLKKQDTAYRDGGSVGLVFQYLADSDLPVLDLVSADVKIPSYSLTGSATISFSDQKTNQGLDQSLFKKAED
jgi:hypothetical protein